MPKTNGDITRRSILEVSENLFSEKGYDASSMGEIAKLVGINKATIYYHFPDKHSILVALINNMLEELESHLNTADTETPTLQEKIRMEIEYMREKRKILIIIFMEALKEKELNSILFQCSEKIIVDELRSRKVDIKTLTSEKHDRLYLHEFFTGILPLMSFAIFQDKWCSHFNCDKKTITDQFIKLFEQTHMKTH
jgi:AcrR family transcriptional regulator